MNDEKWIEFGFDGTLCQRDEEVPPFHPGIVMLKEFKKRGFKIRIIVQRPTMEADNINIWLDNNGIEYDELVFNDKPVMLRIDDRTINPRFYSLNDVYKEFFT